MSERLEELKPALADKYEIERELDHCGMATVYPANDVEQQRRVAAKVLRPDLAAALGPDRVLRRMRNARRPQPNVERTGVGQPPRLSQRCSVPCIKKVS